MRVCETGWAAPWLPSSSTLPRTVVAGHGERPVLVLEAEVAVDVAVADRRRAPGLELEVAADVRAVRHVDDRGALALDVAVDVRGAGIQPGAVPHGDVPLDGGAEQLTGGAGRHRDVPVDRDVTEATVTVAGGGVGGHPGQRRARRRWRTSPRRRCRR